MIATMVLLIAAAFVLTIWLCWFALNFVFDTSRETYRETRHYLRVNLGFASLVLLFIALMGLLLRHQGGF